MDQNESRLVDTTEAPEEDEIEMEVESTEINSGGGETSVLSIPQKQSDLGRNSPIKQKHESSHLPDIGRNLITKQPPQSPNKSDGRVKQSPQSPIKSDIIDSPKKQKAQSPIKNVESVQKWTTGGNPILVKQDTSMHSNSSPIRSPSPEKSKQGSVLGLNSPSKDTMADPFEFFHFPERPSSSPSKTLLIPNIMPPSEIAKQAVQLDREHQITFGMTY